MSWAEAFLTFEIYIRKKAAPFQVKKPCHEKKHQWPAKNILKNYTKSSEEAMSSEKVHMTFEIYQQKNSTISSEEPYQ